MSDSTQTTLRFPLAELTLRAIRAASRRANWNGPYPYEECSECFEQIHVGGQYICDDCKSFHEEQETKSYTQTTYGKWIKLCDGFISVEKCETPEIAAANVERIAREHGYKPPPKWRFWDKKTWVK